MSDMISDGRMDPRYEYEKSRRLTGLEEANRRLIEDLTKAISLIEELASDASDIGILGEGPMHRVERFVRDVKSTLNIRST